MGCFFIGITLLIVAWLFSINVGLGIMGIIGIFVLAFVLTNSEENKKNEIKTKKTQQMTILEHELKDYNFSQRFTSYDDNVTIMVDENAKKLCIAEVSETNGKSEVYDYKDILESEIIEDGQTVTKTSRSGQIGGALVGGVLAGGVGAIIGGLSAKQTSDNEVNRVDLKIIVNNTKSPLKLVNFTTADVPDFNGKNIPMKKDDLKYKEAMKKANHWHSLISVLIRQADNEEKKETSSNSVSNLSTADEIRKLLDLKNDGILTEEEFNLQKQRILSS